MAAEWVDVGIDPYDAKRETQQFPPDAPCF